MRDYDKGHLPSKAGVTTSNSLLAEPKVQETMGRKIKQITN